MEARLALGAIRLTLRGAKVGSFRSERVAPFLCGVLKSIVVDDPNARDILRKGLLAVPKLIFLNLLF